MQDIIQSTKMPDNSTNGQTLQKLQIDRE